MANLDVTQATRYHVPQTLGGSCWLAALACALSAKLRTPGKPSENALKLVAGRLRLDYQWADTNSWNTIAGYLSEMYRTGVEIADWQSLPDSWTVRDLIKDTVNGCGSIILTVRTGNGDAKHDIAVLGIEAVSENPLHDKLTVCDPGEMAPAQVTLNSYWNAGIVFIVKIT